MGRAILLTGGTGFLGRHLAPELAAWARDARYKLKALVRRPLDRPVVQALRELDFVLLTGGLRSLRPAELAPQLRDVGTIVHLASVLEGERRALLKTNYYGTMKLLEAAHIAGVEKIVYLSSLGASSNPAFPYAHSIWLAERAVRESGLQFAILRAAVLLGPGDPFTAGLLQMLHHWPIVVLPRSKTRFQPLWIGDLISCILRMLGLERLPNESIELGGPEVVTLAELFGLLQAELQIDKPVVYLPRRPLRAIVRFLRRRGIGTPLVPGHLIGGDNVVVAPDPVSGAEREGQICKPRQPLREALREIVRLHDKR